MKVRVGKYPLGENYDNYPDDTEFVLDDKPKKIDPKTFEIVKPDDPRYDSLPYFDFVECKFIYNN